jgi:3-oxoacyl-[acyl-carrier-protein] synthase-3
VAYLRAFGAHLPPRVVTNAEMAAIAGCEPDWIRQVSGVGERRFAEGTVADLAVAAGEDCLARAGAAAADLGMVMVATGSSPRRFPGPAASVAHRLGAGRAVAIDLPMASAGSLFAMSLASRLAGVHRHVLVIGSEKMSDAIVIPPVDRNVAVLFGDGAGACLVSEEGPGWRVVDSALYSDGSFAEDLRLEFGEPPKMNGMQVIMQAARKIPRAIADLLEANGHAPADVGVFLMHQANRNLLVKVAQALGVPPERFYSNIERYGNTSSASMLIAAAEWAERAETGPIVFAAFGAGFHWGALLAER